MLLFSKLEYLMNLFKLSISVLSLISSKIIITLLETYFPDDICVLRVFHCTFN